MSICWADESTITYNYDAGNRYTSLVDSITGTITPTFDNLDRLTEEATPQGTISYSYDNAGRRTSATVSGQTAVDYAYDTANRVTGITQGSSTSVSLSYDSANRRSSLTLPNGIVVSYSYDNASELTGLTYTLGSSTLGNLTYSYDSAGRRINVGGNAAATELPTAVSTTTYNADNQLTAWGSASLSYDLNGNLTNDGTNTYVWNARNKLSSMNSSATTFQYDPYGRRVAKTVSGTTTNYLYDRANVAQELSGGSVLSNWLTGRTDEIFAGTDSTGQANFLRDGLGSTLALTNSSGGNIITYAYEPFGKTTITYGSSTNEFQYAGRENDGTGLYFNRARYYHPIFQRFVSEDPIDWLGGTNLTAYAENSPPNLTDPLGFYPQDMYSPEVCQLFGFGFNFFQVALLPIGGSGVLGGLAALGLSPVRLGCAAQLQTTRCQLTTMSLIGASLGSAGAGVIGAVAGSDIAGYAESAAATTMLRIRTTVVLFSTANTFPCWGH